MTENKSFIWLKDDGLSQIKANEATSSLLTIMVAHNRNE
jgi:hypothetical protein